MSLIRKLAFWRRSVKALAPEAPSLRPEEDDVPTLARAALGSSCPSSVPGTQSVPRGNLPPISPLSRASSTPSLAPVTAKTEVRETCEISSPVIVTSKKPSPRVSFASCATDEIEDVGKEEPAPSGSEKPSSLGATTRSSTPLDGQDSLNFDASFEQTLSGIGEAFGQMIATSLQSSKWDKRSQALKAITTVLKELDIQCLAPPGHTGLMGKGLRLRDRTRCWRLTCQLLNHLMRDKVMPVRLAALDLFTDTFANCDGVAEKVEIQYAAGVLLDHVIDKLGDSNLRLHESARKCVFFAAERPGMLGLAPVLSKLRDRLLSAPKGGEKAKVHFGVLDAASLLFDHFPASRANSPEAKSVDDDLDEDDEDVVPQSSSNSWTLDDVIPFILAGSDDTLGTRVRNSGISLAVIAYQAFGLEALEPTLKSMRPAKQAVLREKFKEVDTKPYEDEEDDGEEGDTRPDLDGFLICGSAMKLNSTAPQATLQASGTIGLSSLAPVDEDTLMDNILEEAGLVFNGSTIVNEAMRGLPHFGYEQDDYFLERELAELGLDVDEQRALIESFEEELAYAASYEAGGFQNQSFRELSGSFSVEAF
jgi:hypothetical protein